MKKTKEFYKELFTKLYIAYGYLPYPKDVQNDDSAKEILYKLWDDALGKYDETQIESGLAKCIDDNPERMPRYPSIAIYASTETNMTMVKEEFNKIMDKVDNGAISIGEIKIILEDLSWRHSQEAHKLRSQLILEDSIQTLMAVQNER